MSNSKRFFNDLGFNPRELQGQDAAFRPRWGAGARRDLERTYRKYLRTANAKSARPDGTEAAAVTNVRDKGKSKAGSSQSLPEDPIAFLDLYARGIRGNEFEREFERAEREMGLTEGERSALAQETSKLRALLTAA